MEGISLKLRNSAKAIILNNNSVLVTKHHDESGIFYLLPGGGQEPGEKLTECLIRECIEETGYEIEVKELLFVRECFLDKDIHRVEFIFKGEIGRITEITEMDNGQLGIEWLDLDNILNEPLFPAELRKLIESHNKGQREKTYLGEIV
ncbi:NUDIX domain-containing protein [Paenibacillus donghaensis]|uniref:NUDIX domain-containing protein n=1 Tax=Paenibacillus donghaensis TaxID=414771 RepID=UPI001D16D6EC|nr:NUDIX domain-containing protein [Paenibacillus donghaensis]